MRHRFPADLELRNVGDLIDFACARSDADYNAVLTATARVLGTDDWPDGDEPLEPEQAIAVLMQLGFRREPKAEAGSAGAAGEKARQIPTGDSIRSIRTVAALIDFVGADPDAAINGRTGMVSILNAAMAVMESDGWPDGEESLTQAQSVQILLRLGFVEPDTPSAVE